MDRAYSIIETKGLDDKKRTFSGMATTPAPDRVNDTIDPMGARFKNPLVLLHQHDHSAPIGTVKFGKATAKGIPFEAEIPVIDEPGPLRDRVETAWGEIKHGLVRAVSIGFRPLKYEYKTDGGVHFGEIEVMELSAVSVPANAEAVISVVKTIDSQLRHSRIDGQAALGRKAVKSGVRAAASGVKPNAMKGNTMAKMSLADQIAAFQNTRTEKAARLSDILDEGQGSTLDASAKEEFDALEADLAEIDSHVKRLQTAQKAQVATMRAVDGGDGEKAAASRSGTIAAVAKAPKAEAGIRFARFVKAKALAFTQQRSLDVVAEELFSQRDPEMVSFAKAAVSAHTTGNMAALIGNDGGFADFVEFLRPQTILGRFGTNGIPALRQVPFRVPLILQATGTTGYWVGEGKAKPVTGLTATRTELLPMKVANIGVATMELLRDSTPSAERLLRDDMVASLVAAMDAAFIDPANAGVSGVKPASITNGVSGTASAGADAASVRTDAQVAMAAFVAAENSLDTGVWIMSGANALAISLMQNALGQTEFPGMTVMGGTFFGLPVIVSSRAGTNIALVKASDIYFGDEGGIDVAISTEASLEMLDNPTGDSGTPTAAQLVSMFQTNSVAVRAERSLNWMKRRASAVSLITGAAYEV